MFRKRGFFAARGQDRKTQDSVSILCENNYYADPRFGEIALANPRIEFYVREVARAFTNFGTQVLRRHHLGSAGAPGVGAHSDPIQPVP